MGWNRGSGGGLRGNPALVFALLWLVGMGALLVWAAPMLHHAAAQIFASPIFAIPLYLAFVVGLIWFLQRTLGSEKSAPEVRAVSGVGAAPIFPLVIAATWLVAFPLASLAAYSGVPTLQAIDSKLAMLLVAIGWGAVPAGVVLWWRRRFQPTAETLPDGAAAASWGGLDRLDLRPAIATHRAELYETRVVLPAAEAAELENELGAVPARLAHRACDALVSRAEPGVRVSCARRRVSLATSVSSSTVQSEIERVRSDLAQRDWRERAREGFRGAARELRGQEGADGLVVISLAILAYPTGVDDVPVENVGALRALLGGMVPIDPRHVLAIAVGRCPTDRSRVFDGADIEEAFPEMRSLEV